jgi:AcrR family transcriptional regulator
MADPGMDKRDAILSAALTLFSQRGFHGTPTSLISKEAGVATGTLFFYFRTKEELIDKLYRRIKEEAAAEACWEMDRGATAQEKLLRVGHNLVVWGLDNPEKMMFLELFAHSPFISPTARREGMSRFLFLQDLIRDGIEERSIRDRDPQLLIFMMASAISGLVARVSLETRPADRELIIREGFDVIWNGMTGETMQHGRNKKERELVRSA